MLRTTGAFAGGLIVGGTVAVLLLLIGGGLIRIAGVLLTDNLRFMGFLFASAIGLLVAASVALTAAERPIPERAGSDRPTGT